ncbi:MAG: bifunctional transaldolase/phosoglucose isomerase [Candidatus Methylomirabilota bacterium]
MNPLKALQGYGQSVWLDYIRRGLIVSGELKKMIDEDGLRGVTSNPAIFEKAIAGSADYAAALDELQRRPDLDAMGQYEHLAIRDIQEAADVMRSVYDQTGGRDGYVSLEVSPNLARDTRKTIQEARRLWKAVGRDNVMIKVPATPEGIPAIQQLISEGINVNVTLLFAERAYEEVAQAYISGLETLAAQGGAVSRVASVASFFISRIDTAIDTSAAARLQTAQGAAERALLRSILGKVAIANAKLTYQRYQEIFRSPRWQALALKGAQTQRLLWASTGTKNPKYPDVLYVEELIGPDTVNTIPPATFEAFRDHGQPRASLEEGLEEAHDTMAILEKVGISMTQVADKLLEEGVQLFVEAFDKLLGAVEKRCQAKATHRLGTGPTYALPPPLVAAVKDSLRDWQAQGKVRKLWARDASLWTSADEANWLGWLGIAQDQLAHIQRLTGIAEEVRRAGFSHALLLGMGGSSLCPEVMKLTFGRQPGHPDLHILDSTDPAQILALQGRVDLAKTLFIVSSKSGSTLEPNIFKQYFFDQAANLVGAQEAGKRFIAITDPGSKMQQVAEGDGFRHVFPGVPSIGGRYSALSDFGMVPSALLGVDVRKFLDGAEEMVQSCASCIPAEENPGVLLGTVMGVAAKNGRDKLTLIASPGIWDLGAWLEQLVAESTGKQGRGIIPVDRETVGPPEIYGTDRLFVYLRLASAPDAGQDEAVMRLEQAGQPVVRINLADAYALGAEFFRWEIATAVAGAIIGINPFDQPDVEASKLATRRLTTEYEKTGSLPAEESIFQGDGIRLYTDQKNAAALAKAAGHGAAFADYLRAHLGRIQPGDYLALLAYIEMNNAHERQLQAIRHTVRDAKRVATCLGFGPRFLHSTGQAYKGGPNSGVFLQITCDDAKDLPVPGQKYTFGVVKAAQARGDFQVLAERGRRALRVHLGADVPAGLVALHAAIRQALAEQ